jgi:hypothetical protein
MCVLADEAVEGALPPLLEAVFALFACSGCTAAAATEEEEEGCLDEACDRLERVLLAAAVAVDADADADAAAEEDEVALRLEDMVACCLLYSVCGNK